MIESYEPSMLGELVSAYNRAVRGVPHCYPVSERDFEDALSGTGEGSGPDRRLHDEILLVARRGGSVDGFAHGGIADPGKEGEALHGAIVFLWYEPGRRALGQSLLEDLQDRLKSCGIDAVTAYEQDFRYPFYGYRHAYLSHHMGHVQALLGMNGYQRVKGEIFSDWPDFVPIPPDPPAEGIRIEVKFPQGRGLRPGVEVRALAEGGQIGFCSSRSCGDFSRSPEVQDWIFTDSLNIAGGHQGRGLGRNLLRRSLQEAHRIGYRHAAISNDWDNHRAFLFYTNFGYRVADWTYCLRRELTEPSGQGRRRDPPS